MNLTIRQLRVFMEVAKSGSMIQAAAALHLTPPAVSMQIKAIEGQVGLTLFDRNKRKVQLSTAGEHFLVYARRLLIDLKEAEDAMARLKELDAGLLTIGIVSTAAYFMPRLLARFQTAYPAIDVKLRVVYSHKQLVELMEVAEVDLLAMALAPRDLPVRADTFGANPFVFVCPPRHGCTPRVAMEIPSTETMKQAVMAGMGLGYLPLHTLGLELRNGLLGALDIRDTPVMDVWNVVHLSSRVLSPAAEAFRRFMMDEGKGALREFNAKLLALAFKGKPRRASRH
jgi:DNA-binding transcriptional LysR family regulator